MVAAGILILAGWVGEGSWISPRPGLAAEVSATTPAPVPTPLPSAAPAAVAPTSVWTTASPPSAGPSPGPQDEKPAVNVKPETGKVDRRPLPEWLFASAQVALGYLSPKVSAVGGGPTLFDRQLELSGGYRLAPLPIADQPSILSFGLAFGYHSYAQTSPLDPNTGAFQGSRLSFAPFGAIQWGTSVVAQLEGEFLGAYKLSFPSQDGADLSYTSPLGGKLAVYYRAGELIHTHALWAGLQVEYLHYTTRADSLLSGPVNLRTPFNLWEVALAIAYVP